MRSGVWMDGIERPVRISMYFFIKYWIKLGNAIFIILLWRQTELNWCISSLQGWIILSKKDHIFGFLQSCVLLFYKRFLLQIWNMQIKSFMPKGITSVYIYWINKKERTKQFTLPDLKFMNYYYNIASKILNSIWKRKLIFNFS